MLSRTTERVYEWQLTIISTVHTKNMVSFLPRGENICQELHEILAMIENPKEENRLLPRNNNCVFKILNDGNTIYLPPNQQAACYFVLSGLLFYCEKKPFHSNWFCWLVLPPMTAFIGFHEDRLGGTNPQQSTGRIFPLVFRNPFEMDWF
jgi:hypothetical protein